VTDKWDRACEPAIATIVLARFSAVVVFGALSLVRGTREQIDYIA
jgi:hypothetical protein